MIKVFGVIVIVLVLYIPIRAQNIQQKLPDKTRILFLLDGSGSMLAKWGDSNRMNTAKELLTDLVDSLKVNSNLDLALRAYGHQYSRQTQNCKDTRLEVGFNRGNHQNIINKLKTINPKGTTPIAYSLQQAAEDFPNTPGYRNIIIIITDGIESCDGDPCAVSLALQKKGIFLKPFVIGIGMGRDFQKQFSCIGQFYDAKDVNSFKLALAKAINTTLDKTTVSVELLDVNGDRKETNVNVSFVNNFTKVSTFDFIHYRDRHGRPDTVEIDAVLTYDVVVNTLPATIKRNVRLTAGQHNVITIKSPQGSLFLKQSGHTAYKQGVRAIIRKNGTKGIVNIHNIQSKQKYLVGMYEVEFLTLPRKVFKNIKVDQSKTTELSLPDPGLLNIHNNASGYGSIYEVKPSGIQSWVCDLDHNQARITLALQPGLYKIVFRVGGAPGSKYTSIKTIKILSGRSALVKLFN